MSFVTEQDDMSVISTMEDDNETVIKHYRWRKASGQLQAKLNGTCICKQNTEQLWQCSNAKLYLGMMNKVGLRMSQATMGIFVLNARMLLE